jgi:AraC-like DNA-binding protein
MLDRDSCPLPSFRLGAAELLRNQRFEAWHEITRPLYDTTPLTAEQQFETSVESYLLDDVVMNRCTVGPHTLARRRRHLSSDANDHLALRVYTRGQTVQTAGERVMVMAPGTITLVDRRHEMCGRSSAGDLIGALISRRRIDTRWFDKTPAIIWSTDSPQGRLLAHATLKLWADLPQAVVADAAALAAGFTGLINGLLTTRPDAEQRAALDKATLPAMQQFIERHLHDPELGTGMLCRAFHCSRARLYRLFKPLGGIERHVRVRRLQRCFDQLAQADGKPRRVNAVAATWGFYDPSHFHRLFKARFQMTPSDALALGRAPPGRAGRAQPARAKRPARAAARLVPPAVVRRRGRLASIPPPRPFPKVDRDPGETDVQRKWRLSSNDSHARTMPGFPRTGFMPTTAAAGSEGD